MMGYGGRWSRMIYDGFRRYNLKIVEHSVTRRTFSSRPISGEASILQKTKQRKSCFADAGKKCYHAGSHDEVSELQGWRQHIWYLETALIIVVVANSLSYVYHNASWETVPFTKRSQLGLRPASDYKNFGEEHYRKLIESVKAFVVPSHHPQSVRVRAIVLNLVEAFQRKGGSDRNEGDWDFLLVDLPTDYAARSLYGKIVVFTGAIKSCQQDAEIAALIAPEIGHDMARHSMEKQSKLELLTLLYLLTILVFASSVPSLSKYLRFPFARSLCDVVYLNSVVYLISWMGLSGLLHKFYSLKMDVEADYIGLLLLDTTLVWLREKMGRGDGVSMWEKMRARLLVLGMEEALSIYKEVIDARGDA